jgi:imidazoleglycerol-phosphate dehydratase
MRKADIDRKTTETTISLRLNLDGAGACKAKTGVGFLDHMLDLLARHGGIDLTVKAKGDTHVDDHHLVEDVGIVLGQALKQALGKKEGIARYGWAVVPMDEALVMCALDLGGRPHLAYGLDLPVKRIKGAGADFQTELIEEFFRAVVNAAGMNLHLRQLDGRNTHHIIEGAFKAFAQALAQAVMLSTRYVDVPSTKGVL